VSHEVPEAGLGADDPGCACPAIPQILVPGYPCPPSPHMRGLTLGKAQLNRPQPCWPYHGGLGGRRGNQGASRTAGFRLAVLAPAARFRPAIFDPPHIGARQAERTGRGVFIDGGPCPELILPGLIRRA